MKKLQFLFAVLLLLIVSACSSDSANEYEAIVYDSYQSGFSDGYTDGYWDAVDEANDNYDDAMRKIRNDIEVEYGISIDRACAMLDEQDLYTREEIILAAYAISSFYYRATLINFENMARG